VGQMQSTQPVAKERETGVKKTQQSTQGILPDDHQ